MHLQNFIKVYQDIIPQSLLTAIDNNIYDEPKLFNIGETVSPDGESRVHEARSVKTFSLTNESVGASVSKRIIFNELIKVANTVEKEYQKFHSFYDSNSKHFEFLYYNHQMEGKYDWHIDHGETVPRNLTMLIGLNDDYLGGELQIIDESNSFKLKRNQIVAFPSNFCFPHRVKKVTEGERKVLVIWTT